MEATCDDERESVPTSDGHCSVRLVNPPCKRIARAVTAPGGIRITRKQAVTLKPGTSSSFKGVSLRRRKGNSVKNGRWEAQIWDRENQKQVYLGGFDVEKEAAVAYGIAVIKFRPHDAETRLVTNCPISNYEQGLLHLDEASKEEVVQSLRKQSRRARKKKEPSSQYKGVSKHTKGGWEARRNGYLGLYTSEIEAAIACDKEAVRCLGIDAVTNFDLADYKHLLDADSIKEAEKRHIFEPKLQAANTAASETAHGQYYTQEGQGQPEGLTEMQLVQTDMQHFYEDRAANNLQHYGDYMVQGTDHAALVSPAAGPGEQVWSGLPPLQETTMDMKRLPADVSRHDTPTSVFDIFNNLHISGTTASVQVADQLQQRQSMTGFAIEAVEPALTDIPHMAMHPQGYEAMISDDDDWLKEFATAQVQAHHSPQSVHNGPEAQQAGEPIMPDYSML